MTKAIKSKFVSKFCGNSYTLDSQYELNFAIYLDMLFERGEIMGWVKNTTRFALSEVVRYKKNFGKDTAEQKHYIPDFIVFNKDGSYKIIEIKGWQNEKNTAIKAQVLKDFANLNYEFLGRDEILALQKQILKENKGSLPFGWAKIR